MTFSQHSDFNIRILRLKSKSWLFTFAVRPNKSSVFPTDQAKSVQFQPTDPKIVNTADKVDFHCRHDDSGLNVMLWYQQTDTGAMELIGYSYVGSEAVYEKAFESRFRITRKDTQTGGLNIDDASASDSAVYFCAGSTQWCGLMKPHD